MDFIWTIALLAIGYFVYNWYSRLQQEAKEERDPEARIEGQPPMSSSPPTPDAHDTDYIDYEELKD